MSCDGSADTPLDKSDAIDLAQELQTRREARDRRSLFFVEGIRNFLCAVDGGWTVETLLYSERLLTSGIARRQVRALVRQRVPTVRLSPEEFREVSGAPRASGVGVLLRQRASPIHRVKPRGGRCWLAVQQTRSAGNLGTLLRTSLAVGGSGLIVVGRQVDPFCPGLIRASMGAIFHQQIVRTSPRGLFDWSRRHRLQVVGATPDGGQAHFSFRFESPSVVALGDERTGLGPEFREICTDFVTIPMHGNLDSLNVSVAGSLLMYEVLRRAPWPK